MTKRIVSIALLLGLLTACGNKGPLVLPDKKPADAPATSTGTHPATSQPGAQTSQE